MSQLNSGIGTKACMYDFTKDGALGAGNFAFSGISLKPGEAILDIRFVKLENFTSNNPGTFSFGWGSPNGFFGAYWADTFANMNFYIWSLNSGVGLTKKFNDQYFPRMPATLNISLLFYFTSSQPLTAGRGTFVVTYQYAKF